MKKILLALFMAISVSVYSQVGISGYVENAVGINYDFSNRLGLDFKIITNGFNSVPLTLSINYKFIKTDTYNFYAGIGAMAKTDESDILRAAIIPVGFEVAPFESAKKLSFIVELMPTINDDFVLNKLFGIRYSLGN